MSTNRGKPLPMQLRQHIWLMAAAQVPKAVIARELNVDRHTVRKYLQNKFPQQTINRSESTS